MLNVRRTVLAALFTAAFAIPVAWAAGMWSTLPIVGGSSFCASTVTGTNTGGTTSSICGQTVPAGPPSLTGAEKFPADTGLSGGAPPQTVVVTTCQLGGGSMDIDSVLVSTTSKTIANQICYYVFGGSGTIGAYTLVMPSSPLDGQILRISSGGPVITTLTMSANSGQTLKGAATSMSANAAVGAWIYHASDTTWYRVQ